jgi:hypothetical protein
VVVDAPPVLPVTDATILAQRCDAVLLAATAGLSDRREWTETMERLEVIKADVMGTALSVPDSRAERTTAYHYAPTAAPANWWVTQASAAEQAKATASPADVTTVLRRDPVDELLWDEGRAPAAGEKRASADTARASAGRPATGSGSSRSPKKKPTDGDRRNGSDGNGGERGTDGGLKGSGPSDGHRGDATDPTDGKPFEAPGRQTLPPPKPQRAAGNEHERPEGEERTDDR